MIYPVQKEEMRLMFTRRLNELFEYIGAKNGHVAKLAGFDRTNISRLRSSGRTPKKNSRTTGRLVLGLYLYADDRNELDKLCSYIGATPDGAAEEILEALKDWLYEGEPEQHKDACVCTTQAKCAKAKTGLSLLRRTA